MRCTHLKPIKLRDGVTHARPVAWWLMCRKGGWGMICVQPYIAMLFERQEYIIEEEERVSYAGHQYAE